VCIESLDLGNQKSRAYVYNQREREIERERRRAIDQKKITIVDELTGF